MLLLPSGSTSAFAHGARPKLIESFSILVASVLVQGGIATNAVDRPLRYNQRRSWLPIVVFCTKNMGYFLVVRSP